ncbi:unnamed protein product [Urochloa humidicola]
MVCMPPDNPNVADVGQICYAYSNSVVWPLRIPAPIFKLTGFAITCQPRVYMTNLQLLYLKVLAFVLYLLNP